MKMLICVGHSLKKIILQLYHGKIWNKYVFIQY